MSKLTSQQKEFLKGIPNKKARQEQKIQFKLQNSYNGNVVFINGKFETDLEKLAHFMNGHPMMDIMFKEEFLRCIGKEDLIPKENNHKFIDYGEFKNTIPDFKHNFNQKPLEFDLLTNKDIINYIECLSIQDIIDSRVLIESSPLCQNLKNHLSELVSKRLKEQL